MGCRVARTLGQLGEIAGGATPSTKKPSYWNGDIPWLSPKDLTNYAFRYIGHGERSITRSGYDNSSTVLLPAGTVLFSSRAPIGYVAIASNPVCTNQGFKSVVPYDGTDSLFLYYLLKFNRVRIEGLGSGTTFKEVSATTMRGIEVDVPRTIDEQRRIASVLDSIDSKIETNARLNGYLAELAQTLYNDWFRDFGHWDGRMPSHWESGVLGDYVTVKRGGSPRPIQEYLSNEGLRWLKIADVSSINGPYILEIKEHIKEEGLRRTVYLEPGSLVLSNSATPGIPKILSIGTCIHDGWLYFPQSEFTNEWLYCYFLNVRQELVRMANGSVFQNLKTDIVKNFEVIRPDDETLASFQKTIAPLFGLMETRQQESKQLAELRDALLPKLMSGEIDVTRIDLTQLNSHLT